MRVRLTIHRPDLGKAPGDVLDLDAERGLRLIQAGQAEAVPQAAEAAVTTSEEKAVLPAPAQARQKAKKS